MIPLFLILFILSLLVSSIVILALGGKNSNTTPFNEYDYINEVDLDETQPVRKQEPTYY